MKKEQLLDMIGEAPERDVYDAGRYKRRLPRMAKWLGGIAAVLAVVLLVQSPGMPLMLSAKAVSIASEARILPRPKNGSSDAAFDAWRADINTRDALTAEARAPIADFAGRASAEMLASADGENRLWSPINAYIALAMTAEMTGSETQAELLELLGAEDTDTLGSRVSAVWETLYRSRISSEVCTLANSLWLDDDAVFVQEKMDTLAHDYYASVYQGDLGSARTNRAITAWMQKETGGFLSERTGKVELSPEERVMTIASTIYFRSKWSSEFSAACNTEAVFHAPDGDVTRTFMNKTEAQMNYFWAEDFGAVQMPLKNGASMWFILPDEDKTVDDVLRGGEYMAMVASDESFPDENHKWMKVNFSVPKFDVSAGIDLKEGLQALGLTKIFEPLGNDFSPSVLRANEFDEPVYLAGIHQDTRVQIDEEGVAAASYIELNFGAGAAAPPDEVIDFVLDRPFLFVISKQNIPLFAGTICRP